MELSENAQEILELLWVATEEEAQGGLAMERTPPGGVDELVQRGLAQRKDERVTLTRAGRPEAAQAVRRHRLAERLLTDVLTTEEIRVDEHACRFEHVLLPDVDEGICTLLGHPRFCPHGKPIPRGECCKQMQESVERLIAPLCELEPSQEGHIAYIRMSEPKRLQKLMAMGVLPGASITLLRRTPSFVLEVGYTQFAVDEEIAADIHVRLNHQAP